MAEDCNALAADCIVISCCCQCLVLQIIVFVLVGLPRKLIRKTRELARKRLRRRKRRRERRMDRGAVDVVSDGSGSMGFGVFETEGCEVEMDGEVGKYCVEEVERVLGELVERGEFGFGSFWRRSSDGSHNNSQEFDPFSVVQLHLIEVVGPLICKA